MGATITVLNNGQRMATTDRAFDDIETKELMREWTLEFSVTNRDNARQYVIDPDAQFEIDGQIFDTKSYKQSSGTDNTTSVTAWHVLTRMNNYMIPAGYAFVGTIAALIQDILTQSGASAEFTVGTCAAVSGSYSPGNTQPINAYSAIMGLTALGVEPSYDNFTINAPVRWGADTGKVFKFGRDLCSLERTYDKTTTPAAYSYGIDIADLQRISGASVEFVEGDTVEIQDSLIGDAIIGQRIISYKKSRSDPTQDKVTIGNFISDLSDSLTTMQVDISATTAVSSNSVQQGDKYSNVSIDHTNGFMAVNAAGTVGVKMNADNCFAVYSISGGVWTLMSELDINGLQAGTIRAPGSSVYGVIGHDATYGDGLILHDPDKGLVSTFYPGGYIVNPNGDVCSSNFITSDSVIVGNRSQTIRLQISNLLGDAQLICGSSWLTVDSSGLRCSNGYTTNIVAGSNTYHFVQGICTGMN